MKNKSLEKHQHRFVRMVTVPYKNGSVHYHHVKVGLKKPEPDDKCVYCGKLYGDLFND